VAGQCTDWRGFRGGDVSIFRRDGSALSGYLCAVPERGLDRTRAARQGLVLGDTYECCVEFYPPGMPGSSVMRSRSAIVVAALPRAKDGLVARQRDRRIVTRRRSKLLRRRRFHAGRVIKVREVQRVLDASAA